MIEWVRGNLLAAKVDALVNTVNTVGVMGKGIALQFKKAFPGNFKVYEAECQAERMRIGKVFVYDHGRLLQPRFIINFPTKKHWKGHSKIEYVQEGLVDLVEQVRRLQIKSIALPPLGCGHGGLDWAEVKPLIEAAFAPLPDVKVLVFEPAGAPAPEEMLNRTPKPEVTPGRAAVVSLMHRYLDEGLVYPLSLLELQKLAYFLQVAGQPLNLDFKRHFYGPYSDKLRHVLNHIEGHFTEGYGDGRNKPTTPIKLKPGAAKVADEFLTKEMATQERLARVSQLIEGFETPYGMELLASVHWVAMEHPEARVSVDAAVKAVHAWSVRKAKLMKPEHIRSAWQRLAERGWLTAAPQRPQ